eukprot:scaffold2.g7417.t1
MARGKASRQAKRASASSDAQEGAPLKGKKLKDKCIKDGQLGARRRGRRQHSYDEGDVAAELRLVGLRVKEVAADGNCFFHSCCDQVEGEGGAHLAFRRRVVDYMTQHREQFEPFIEDDEPFDKYVKRMGKEGTWAGHLELQAASLVLGANISIYQAGQPIWRITNFPDEGAPLLHLSYHDGMHWNSVRAADDFSSGPPAPVRVAAAPADPTALAARQRAWGEAEAARVAAGTGCRDPGRVERALEASRGDVGAAIEALIERLGQEEQGGDGGSSAQPSACDPSSSGGGGDTGEEQQEEQQVEQQARSTSREALRAGGGSGQPSASGRVVPAAEVVRLRLVCSEPSTEAAAVRGAAAAAAAAGVRVELMVEGEGASSGPGPPGSDGSEDEGEGGRGRRPGKPAGKKGGKRGAVVGGPARRNKPCPCGSREKFKNCCGRNRGRGRAGGGAAAAAGEGDEGEGGPSAEQASVLATKLQQLHI